MAKKNVREIYNLCRTLVAQINEKANKKEKIDPALLTALKGAFSDIIEYEKIFLIQRENRFFGILLMDLELEINFSQRGPTDLHVNASPMSLSINPIFCANYTFPEFTGLIIEELMKMVYLHPAIFSGMNKEKDKFKHKMLEKASDASAASILKRDIHLDSNTSLEESGCRLPKDSYTPTTLNNECGVHSTEQMPLEYYYGILRKFKDKNSGDGSTQKQNQNGGSSSQGNDSGSNQPNQQSQRRWIRQLIRWG